MGEGISGPSHSATQPSAWNFDSDCSEAGCHHSTTAPSREKGMVRAVLPTTLFAWSGFVTQHGEERGLRVRASSHLAVAVPGRMIPSSSISSSSSSTVLDPPAAAFNSVRVSWDMAHAARLQREESRRMRAVAIPTFSLPCAPRLASRVATQESMACAKSGGAANQYSVGTSSSSSAQKTVSHPRMRGKMWKRAAAHS